MSERKNLLERDYESSMITEDILSETSESNLLENKSDEEIVTLLAALVLDHVYNNLEKSGVVRYNEETKKFEKL